MDLSSALMSRPIRRSNLRENYEDQEARLLRKFLTPEVRVLEVGAGMGFCSILSTILLLAAKLA